MGDEKKRKAKHLLHFLLRPERTVTPVFSMICVNTLCSRASRSSGGPSCALARWGVEVRGRRENQGKKDECIIKTITINLLR